MTLNFYAWLVGWLLLLAGLGTALGAGLGDGLFDSVYAKAPPAMVCDHGTRIVDPDWVED